MGVFNLTLIVCSVFCFATQGKASQTAQINGSQIKGQTLEFRGHEVNQYLGIPYAQPPIGSLRFKKPVPFTNYSSDFKAVKNPPACPQYNKKSYPRNFTLKEQSEDCLYLNIWTPADASSVNKRAVLYFIHGGAFKYGAIRDKNYNGVPLAALGNIVVVTVNYRVGPFGFLSSGSDDAPGNAGLWDMLEGLKWVNEHIESFGGDPSRISITGQSAGSISIGMFTTSPLAQGFYTRLIMQSGSPISRLADDNRKNIELAQILASSVGCADDTFTIEKQPKEVVQCLRDVDFDTLSRASSLVGSFYPQFGDELLPSNPRTALLNGDFRCTDLFIGNNKDDGSFELPFKDPELFGPFGEKNPHINRTIAKNMIKPVVSSYPNPQSIVNHYLPENFTDDSRHQIRDRLSLALGDVFFFCPTAYFAEKCAEQGGNVYYYFFTHKPSVTPWAKWLGSTHFDQVPFVFGKPVLRQRKYRKSEVRLSLQMIDIWSSFVKFGKPSIPWPLYSRENRTFKVLGPKYVKGKNGAGPHSENCDFLRPYFECVISEASYDVTLPTPILRSI